MSAPEMLTYRFVALSNIRLNLPKTRCRKPVDSWRGIVPEEGPIIKLLDGESLDGPWEDRVYSSGTGPVRHLRFPVQIERNPLYWERASDLPGASNAKWTTLAAARS
jgi:hypothetical protein